MDKNFEKIYTTPGGIGFLAGSAKNLYDGYISNNFKPKINIEDAKKFLSRQIPYTVHKSALTNFPRNRFHVKFPGDILSIDLGDVRAFSHENDDHNYFLLAIDAFSKKIWYAPLKNKRASTTLQGFQKILAKIKYKIHNVSVDMGNEFAGVFAKYCKDNDINLFSLDGSKKNSIVERGMRSIKERIFRHVRWKGSHRWLDYIKPAIDAYNKTVHSSIKMAPNDVNISNSGKVYKTLFPNRVTRVPRKLRIGDIVRFSKSFKENRGHSFEGRWSLSTFRIIGSKYTPRGRYPMYKLEYAFSKELFGDPKTKRSFWWYEQDLQKVDEATFASKATIHDLQVEKVKGNKSLVRWVDYPNTKLTWIPTKDIVLKKAVN